MKNMEYLSEILLQMRNLKDLLIILVKITLDMHR